MDQDKLLIMDEEAIQKKWNGFSKSYSSNVARNFVFKGVMMMKLLDIQNAKNIVEVGCGEGRISAEICLRKAKDARFIAVDISQEMCKITSARLQGFAKLASEPYGLLNFESKLEVLEIEEGEFSGNVEIPEMNTTIYKGSNENLKEIAPDGLTDIYLASLSLHIVTHPENMISEAFRVLKPGGKAIMSVWGQKEGSTQFTTIGKILGAEGIQLPKVRDSWHLNDKDSTIKLFANAGFKNILGWNQFIPFKPATEEDLENQTLGMLRGLFSAFPDLLIRVEELSKKITSEYLRILTEEKSPYGFYALVIQAEKPF